MQRRTRDSDRAILVEAELSARPHAVHAIFVGDFDFDLRLYSDSREE